MPRNNKVFVGILSFLPLVSAIVIVIYMFINFLPQMIMLERQYNNDIPPEAVISNLFGFIAVVIVLALINIGLLIYFIIHAINNPQVKQEERIIWILVFIFIHTVGFIVYWAVRVLPKEKKEELAPSSNFVRVE